MLPVTKTTNKPHIRAIKMACDEPIGEIPHPLPDHAFSMLVVSSPGEGKTTFATSLLTKGGACLAVPITLFVTALVCEIVSRRRPPVDEGN